MIDAILADAELGVKRAVIDLRDRRPLVAKTIAHPLVHGLVLRLGVEATPDARLVGHHHDRPGALRGKAREFEDAGQKLDLVDAVHIAAVNIDHAVAVEKQRGPGGGPVHGLRRISCSTSPQTICPAMMWICWMIGVSAEGAHRQ
jgi:hypothetical protein